ncbi:hypothetical protein ACIRPH_31660 [Nocardiopsis sp. NPDC101807]
MTYLLRIAATVATWRCGACQTWNDDSDTHCMVCTTPEGTA